MKDFYNDHTQKVEIETWHLSDYSNMWKISFQENDVTQEITENVSETNKYNTNLNYDVSFGDDVKTGLKFGTSAEQTQAYDYTKKYVLGSNNLGESVINFADDIAVPMFDVFSGWIPTPRKYNTTGGVEFEIRPRLIY
jgi:hypothetical protein